MSATVAGGDTSDGLLRPAPKPQAGLHAWSVELLPLQGNERKPRLLLWARQHRYTW